MVTFSFIDKLSDKRQFELFVIEIVNKYFDVWDITDHNHKYWKHIPDEMDRVTRLDVTELEFCKNESVCSAHLKEEIINNFYQERMAAKEVIRSVVINKGKNLDNVLKDALRQLDLFYNQFDNRDWLSDKRYILDEIEKTKQIISPVKNDFEVDKLKKKLSWHAGPASLATMFYELNTLKTESGRRYINADIDEIQNFILENFSCENEELNKDTIRKYLSEGPGSRKAKGGNKVNIIKIMDSNTTED